MRQETPGSSRRSRGFTLLELLIVVAIVGMLAAIAVPMYGTAVRQARVTALSADLEHVYGALLSYHADHGSFPAERDFDTETLTPLTSEGYYGDPKGLTQKLAGNKILMYVAPDVDGPDQQFILVTRHEADPRIIVVAVHTGVIHSTGGWVDGVFVISDGELRDAGDLG